MLIFETRKKAWNINTGYKGITVKNDQEINLFQIWGNSE